MKRKRLAVFKSAPVAKAVKTDASGREDLKKVVEEIRELRKDTTLGKITIRELIDGGRRY
jgi:hypothetical protein